MKKSSFLMFLDYLLILVLWLLGIFIFSWMLELKGGFIIYSILYTLIFFGMMYSRAWKAAKIELKNKERTPHVTDALLVCMPFVLFNMIIILGYSLIFYNVIPIRDNVVDIIYSFEPNMPRVRNEILLINNLSPIVRIWFAPFAGFLTIAEKYSPVIFLISPIITIVASLLGYFLGLRKYYLSDTIMNISEKVKEKFNE